MKSLIKGLLAVGNIITLISFLLMLYVFPNVLGFSGVAWEVCIILGSVVAHMSYLMLLPPKKTYSAPEERQQEVFTAIVLFSIHLIIMMLFIFAIYSNKENYLMLFLLFAISVISSLSRLIYTVKNATSL